MRLLAGLTILLAFTCAQAQVPAVSSDPAGEYSSLRYADTGLASLNNQCPVTGAALNPHIEPLYVNGRPIGFC